MAQMAAAERQTQPTASASPEDVSEEYLPFG